jgi:hypothetical protein
MYEIPNTASAASGVRRARARSEPVSIAFRVEGSGM